MKYKAISVKQPWAYLLCAGVKDIENMSWKLPEKYKGERVLIHASRRSINGEYGKKVYTTYGLCKPMDYSQISALNEAQRQFIDDNASSEIYRTIREYYEPMLTSAIIGSVRFVDCVTNHPSIWAEKTEVYNEWCKANGCENYIEWSPGYGDCVSCKLIGQSYNIDKIAERCPFKKNAKKPIYNWLVADPILFDKPILGMKGKLGFWDFDLPDGYETILNKALGL